MLNKIFGKKQDEPDISPISPPRPRFRRTRSAASESVYADYLSDDWGDAPTVLHDRYGEEINPRSASPASLEDWQRPQHGVGPGVFSRVRSLSRPNWARAPPTEVPQYGWAQRVEQAGGFDARQERRDEERSRRPVTIPVPNPAPRPIDVRGDWDEGAMVQSSALQAPALVRRSTRGSTRTGDGRPMPGHRSTTSSPKIIQPEDLPKRGGQRGAGPSTSKPANPGAKRGEPATTGGHRRHLSRVEKIAAVLQHVASLPWISDSPVETYYPPKENKIAPPAEPFHTYNIPPSVPKRYQPPPPMPPCWYQPKPPKPPKKKKNKKPAKEMVIPVADDSREFYSGEFEYPDYDELMGGAYTGDTPTLQSDAYTEESEQWYEHYYPGTMIPDESFDDGAGMGAYPIRPAFFPGPIKSTGLTTPRRPDLYQGPLQIMPPPGPGYDEDDYDDYDDEEPSPRGPIPSPLSTSNGRTLSRNARRTPLMISTERYTPPEAYSAITPNGPPLIIPTPTGAPRSMGMPTPKTGPLPGGYGANPQPYARHYEAAAPGATKSERYGSAQGWGQSPRGWGSQGRGPSAQGWGQSQDWGPSPNGRKASAQGWGPSPMDRGPSEQGWGSSPGGQSLEWPPPPGGWGLSPGNDGLGYGFPPPPPMQAHGPPISGHGPPLRAGYGPSPLEAYGPSPLVAYGPSPHLAYGPPPQGPYGPPPQGPSPLQYAAYPYGYYTEPPPQWGSYAGTYTQPTRGDSPPPIPSPIATSIARSRSSRHRSQG